MFGFSDKYRYPLVLALIAGIILAVGLALKPQPAKSTTSNTTDVAATRAELETLQRLIQRNSLRNMGAQFSAVADDVAPYLLPLGDSRRNALAWPGTDDLLPKAMGDLPQTVSVVA